MRAMKAWLKRQWQWIRWDNWYRAHGVGYYQALDDVYESVPEARDWVTQRKAELDPLR
jgi:hypothetical protein